MAFGLIRVSFAAGLKHDGSRFTPRARTGAVGSSCNMADMDGGNFGSISLPTDHLRHEGVLSLLLFPGGDRPTSAARSGQPIRLLDFVRNPSRTAVAHRRDQLGVVRDPKARDVAQEVFQRDWGGVFRGSRLDEEGQGDEGNTSTPPKLPTLEPFPPSPPAHLFGKEHDSPRAGPKSAGPMLEISDEENGDAWSSREKQGRLSRSASVTANRDAPNPKEEVERERSLRQKPWWCELLASPVKRLRLNDWGKMWNAPQPDFRLPDSAQIQENDQLVGAEVTKERKPAEVVEKKKKPSFKTRRTDIPVRREVKGRNQLGFKPTIKRAVELAKSKQKREGILTRIEEDYYSNSSRAAKASRRKSIMKILDAAKASYPLTPESIKMLAGALREAGYKSAYMYIIEAKTHHVELGHAWTHLLDRHFKLTISAAKRGMGPRKKAPEVQEDIWSCGSLLPEGGAKKGELLLAAHLFALGTHWMLREIEIARLTASDVSFDIRGRTVSLILRESKMDQSAKGVMRTLQCLCRDSCDLRCPYAVLEVLVNHAMLKGSPDSHLAIIAEVQQATKAEVIKAWRKLYGSTVTGHSARRSGALQYIRKGWAISQVAFLGRWKSSVILEYAQEALESMAVNGDKKFGEAPLKQSTLQVDKEVSELVLQAQSQVPRDPEVKLAVVQQIQKELAKLKANTKDAAENLQKEIQVLETKWETNSTYLPNLVKSARHQVIHKNNRILVYAPSAQWRSVCGWHYYNSNYEFVCGEDTKVTCTKCQTAAQSKE